MIPAFFQLGDNLFDGIGIGDRTGFDSLVNFWQFLHHNPAGTKIHMADFGIAHLPFGQADIKTAGFQKAGRIVGIKRVPNRGVGQCNRIVLAFLAITPAIQNAQHHRTRALYGI